MSQDFLTKIVDHKRKLNSDKAAFYQTIQSTLDQSEYSSYRIFKQQISQPGKINLIAEVKKASPSKGLIRESFEPASIAKSYSDNGAAAISVLTEEKYFLGKPAYLKQLADEFQVPFLMKDFIICEGQVYEARYLGASAILLIMAILNDQEFKTLLELAHKLDLDALVEVHNEEELKRAIDGGADIVGVNNRNLHTFEVSLKVSEQLIPQIPAGIVTVAESGFQSHSDVSLIQELGANAVLIGETFMRCEDIGAKINELMNG